MPVTIYHNPRCSKSRQTLSLLEEQGVSPHVVLYLKEPLSSAEIQAIIDGYSGASGDLIRGKERGEAGVEETSDPSEMIAQIQAHPKILQRPIVVGSRGVAIGRPPEAVLEVI